MLKRFWKWFIQVPSGLDRSERLYLRGQYFVCSIIALHGPLFLVAAVTADINVLVRLAFLGAAIVTVAIALGLRILIFWIYEKRVQISKRLGL